MNVHHRARATRSAGGGEPAWFASLPPPSWLRSFPALPASASGILVHGQPAAKRTW